MGESKRSLRILLVSSEYPPRTEGGIGSYTASLAGHLASRGHEVHVLSAAPEQPSADEMLDGAVVHRRPQVRGLLTRYLTARRLRAAWSVRREVRRLGLDFDVIEAPEFLAESLLLPRRPPIVVTLHTPIGVVTADQGNRSGIDEALADRLESFAARRAAAMSSPSAMLAERLAGSGWTRGRPVEIVPNPVDVDAWGGSGTSTVPFRVLYVGRLEARKSPELLVRAVGRVAEVVPDVSLVMIGRSNDLHDGKPYVERVRREAADLGLDVQIIEGLHRDELPAWYQSAAVVVVPSTRDNYPMTILEAMASGRPVICTTGAGNASVVAGVDPHAVVPPLDDGALASAIERYLADPVLAAETGRRHRCRIDELVDLAVTAKEQQFVRLATSARGSRR
jgi:glycosyltransferase involved in cell wall biosynthesis